jgi:hypothetical protein
MVLYVPKVLKAKEYQKEKHTNKKVQVLLCGDACVGWYL